MAASACHLPSVWSPVRDGVAEDRARRRAGAKSGIRGQRITAAAMNCGPRTPTEIAALDARIAAMETRLTWRIIGGVAAIGALLRFLG